jgi:putative transposase
MPRLARIHVTGGLFHVISRFHDRRFYLDIDGARQKYLLFLGNAAAGHDSRIIAYCLMSSHVHLVLQLGNDPLSRLTKQTHAPFANWLNRQRSGLGTIFADRPKSVLVHNETYGMSLLSYVHNNPVRAGMVDRASESSWSSHRAYLGLEACPPWLATNAVLGEDEKEHESLRYELACYVDEGRDEARRPEFSGEVSKSLVSRIRKVMGGDIELSYPVLGPDEFVISALKDQVHRHGVGERVRGREISAETVIQSVFESLSLDPKLASQKTKTPKVARGRALCAWMWVEKMGHSQVTIADSLRKSPVAVTKMVGKMRREGLTDDESQLLEQIFKRLFGTNEEHASEIQKPPLSEPKVIILKRQRS